MKGVQLVALSFFKEHRLDYYINGNSLNFLCLECQGQCIMDLGTTNWSCSNCSSSGTLKMLIEKVKNTKSVISKPIFNPKKERIMIRKKFKHVVEKAPDLTQELNELYSKIDRVFAFYMDGNEDKNRSLN